MSIVQKYLLGAAGLLLTVMLIMISLGIFDKGSEVANSLAKEQQDMAVALAEEPVTKYDGYQISGSTAVNYLKVVVDTYGIPVAVTTVNGSFLIKDDSVYPLLRDIHSEQYINPLMEYTCTVIRDDNAVITQVELVYVH